MKIWAIGIATLSRTGSPRDAAAEKPVLPTADQAKKVAAAWMEAMHDQGTDDTEPPSAEVLALTATPFFGVAHEALQEEELCKPTTATDPGGLASLLGCLRKNVLNDGKFKNWSAKVAKGTGLPHRERERIAELGKTARLVMLDDPCAGAFNQVVLAVTLGPEKDASPKVSAVLSLHGDCGE